MTISDNQSKLQIDINGRLSSLESVVGPYAWAVLAAHATVVFHWLGTADLSILLKEIEPLCWPYFTACSKIRFETSGAINLAIIIYATLIFAAAWSLVAKYRRTFWILLVVLNLYMIAVVSLDYRLRGNQFYMLTWLSFAFLVWPARRWAIPLILMSFYFWAGSLKLNYEWLSGAVLYHELFMIPSRFAWLACTYVVVLEMVFIWGLLAKRAWVRWLTLSQLALFHLESITQVNFFYPALMAALLTWFVLDWLVPRRGERPSLASLWTGHAPRSAYALILLFACFQLAPHFYRGDKALTGQGRIFALDMLEARQTCDVHVVIHYRDHTTDSVDLLLPELPSRKICDPIIYYDRVTNLCELHAKDPTFDDADFVMHAKRATDERMTTIVDVPGFCGRRESYRILANNGWMK